MACREPNQALSRVEQGAMAPNGYVHIGSQNFCKLSLCRFLLKYIWPLTRLVLCYGKITSTLCINQAQVPEIG
jgi:hypothetical protein